MQSYSHLLSLEHLRQEDFQLLYPFFANVVEQKIPVFNGLYFVHDSASVEKSLESLPLREEVERILRLPEKGPLCRCLEQTLIFTIPLKKKHKMIGVVTGVDSYLTEHVSRDWLEDFCKSLRWEFQLIKNAAIDWQTGLLNSRQLFAMLEQVSDSPLLLIELYPRARSSREAAMHTAKAVRLLRGYVGEKFPLFSLGHNVYGVLTLSLERKSCHAFAHKLLSWLRNDGFSRVHIGIRCPDSSGGDAASHEFLVEQAYSALRNAAKCGPFSLYDYYRIGAPERHPLRKPPPSVLTRLRKRWQNLDTFSIVQFETDSAQDLATIAALIDDPVATEDELFAILAQVGPQQALDWAEAVISAARLGEVRLGVAYYPHLSFTKGETARNCRKALQHAAFFGHSGKAIFDAVSLNVSGDIYYAEGDLVAAVREYKAGLQCDPANVNLLNSLGVAYADMDRHREALACFAKVAAVDRCNFMALFNAGMAAEHCGRKEEAVEYYEQANGLESEFVEAREDLSFHLGRLYSMIGRNKEALEMLLPWYRRMTNTRVKERALPYLGRIYHGLGQNREAVKWLQRSLKDNEFDAESMGLLGLLYLENGEGDDIALTLCEKSVDMMPDKPLLHLYLARTQIACRLHEGARATLRRCLRSKRLLAEAQLLTAMLYRDQGQMSRARYWLKKVLDNEGLAPPVRDQAISMQEDLHES